MTLVDLSKLPVPDAIETLDYEAILAARKAHMVELFAAAGVMADWNPDLESDPIVIMLQENAYREVTLRARVNDGIRAVMLASALGADLEGLGAWYGVERLTVTPADNNAVPPVAAVMESDDRLRRRIQLAPEGFSTAGPVGAYLFHGLSADADVLDCSITRPKAGDVLVTVLSTIGDGTASPELLAQVT
ncbi:MAG: baseplate J/gp47 family protein, partial [Alphaproteobacteria bacterium]|nr:baseplate J/gp47 family protein [Alphaproteobacteria bacterium]